MPPPQTLLFHWKGGDVYECRWCHYQGPIDYVERHERLSHRGELETLDALARVSEATADFTAAEPPDDKGADS